MLAHVANVQWGDVATWVASVDTVAAVVVALVQVARERRARLTEEAQDRTDRHLAHARLISARTGRAEPVPEAQRVDYGDTEADANYNYRTPVYIHNSSAEPIYEVVAGIVFIQGRGPRTLEGVLELRQEYRTKIIPELAASGEDVSKMQTAWQGNPVSTTGIVPPGT